MLLLFILYTRHSIFVKPATHGQPNPRLIGLPKSRRVADHAEAKIVVAVLRVAAVPASNRTAVSVKSPAAATEDAHGAGCPEGVAHIAVRIILAAVIPVPTPLIYVSAHVIKAVAVFGLSLNLMRLAVGGSS